MFGNKSHKVLHKSESRNAPTEKLPLERLLTNNFEQNEEKANKTHENLFTIYANAPTELSGAILIAGMPSL